MSEAHAFRYSGENDKTPYHYTECGLDNVYLLSGYEREETDYGDGVSVKDADALHVAIGTSLATTKKMLCGAELRFLRKELGMTQSRVAALIGTSVQSVARWEKSETPQPPAADYLIRLLYLQHVGHMPDDIAGMLGSLEQMDADAISAQVFARDDGDWHLRLAA